MSRPRIWRFGDPVEPLRALLSRGGVLAVPTESSYGLAADPRNPAAVAAIYRIKGRGEEKPLPVVAADLAQLADLGIDPTLPILARLAPCWPGPLTVVVPLAPQVPPLPAAAGGASLAVRIPGHAGLRRLLSELGTALTATSANPSGEAPVLDPAGALRLLAGEDAAVVDGGRLPGGPPSTLVAEGPEGIRILRPGRIPAQGLRALVESPASRSTLGERGTLVGGADRREETETK